MDIHAYQVGFGQRLKAIRESLGMSLSELSRRTRNGISTSTLSRMEKGEQPCSCAFLLDISEQLEIKPELLLGGISETPANKKTAGITPGEKLMKSFYTMISLNLEIAYAYADDESEIIIHLPYLKTLTKFAKKIKNIEEISETGIDKTVAIEALISKMVDEVNDEIGKYQEQLAEIARYKAEEKPDPEMLRLKMEMNATQKLERTHAEEKLHAISIFINSIDVEFTRDEKNGYYWFGFLKDGPLGIFTDSAFRGYQTCLEAEMEGEEGRAVINRIIDHYVNLIAPHYWDGNEIEESDKFYTDIEKRIPKNHPHMAAYTHLSYDDFCKAFHIDRKNEGEDGEE